MDREACGRLVRETWVKWASEQPDPKPSWLVPWEDLDAGQREVDMRIGEAVAAAERERIYAAMDRASDRSSLGYVVVTFNQASHQPGLDPGVDLHNRLEDAIPARDTERGETARIGRREHHVIAEVSEMTESGIEIALERERAYWARIVARSKELRARVATDG